MNKRDICESGKNAFVKTPAFSNVGVFHYPFSMICLSALLGLIGFDNLIENTAIFKVFFLNFAPSTKLLVNGHEF